MKNVIIVLLILIFSSCSKNENMHCRNPIKAKHGGKILGMNDAAGHVEFVYNADKGSVRLYFLDMMGNSLSLEENPIFKVLIKTGKDKNYKEIQTSSIVPNQKNSDAFIVKDKILEMNDARGNIQLKIKGQLYLVEFKIVKFSRSSQRHGNHQYENWYVVY